MPGGGLGEVLGEPAGHRRGGHAGAEDGKLNGSLVGIGNGVVLRFGHGNGSMLSEILCVLALCGECARGNPR